MLDKARLQQLYLDEQKSIRDIATLEGVPTRTVYDALMRYRIPRRPAGGSGRSSSITLPFDESTLRGLYLEKGYSIRAIAESYQISTRQVYDALARFEIPRRSRAHKRVSETEAAREIEQGMLNQVQVQQPYEQEGLSIAAIAARLACAPSRVRTTLLRWGVSLRSRGRPAVLH